MGGEAAPPVPGSFTSDDLSQAVRVRAPPNPGRCGKNLAVPEFGAGVPMAFPIESGRRDRPLSRRERAAAQRRVRVAGARRACRRAFHERADDDGLLPLREEVAEGRMRGRPATDFDADPGSRRPGHPTAIGRAPPHPALRATSSLKGRRVRWPWSSRGPTTFSRRERGRRSSPAPKSGTVRKNISPSTNEATNFRHIPFSQNNLHPATPPTPRRMKPSTGHPPIDAIGSAASRAISADLPRIATVPGRRPASKSPRTRIAPR